MSDESEKNNTFIFNQEAVSQQEKEIEFGIEGGHILYQYITVPFSFFFYHFSL